MIDTVRHEIISNLPMGFGLPDLGSSQVEDDLESDTLWDRVIRMCDKYGLKPREHCTA
jgi:hypothetical protein